MVCNLAVATSEKWKDKSTGEMQERTEWHNVVLRNRLAEVAAQYLTKGSKVYIEGSLRTRKWQDSSGQDRYTTELHGFTMDMLSSQVQSDQPQGQSSASAPSQAGGFDDVPF